jgi:CRP-like cAMP-binding protein
MKASNLFKDWQDVREYRAGEVIFSEDDPADALYFILSGEVELQLRGEPLGVEGEGGIIGETAVIGSETRFGTATARSDVRVARLDPEQLKQRVAGNPDFAMQVMGGLAKRLRAVDGFISEHIGPKA